MNKIRYGNSVISYSIVKTKRRKTSQIIVNEKGVEVRTPLTKKDSEIKQLVDEKKQWIFKKKLEFSDKKKGMFTRDPSGERAIPIIEAIVKDSNSYEMAVNIPNDGIIENLPQDLVIECSGTVNKDGIKGLKLGKIPKNIATILRIEASIQDLCVEAIVKPTAGSR